MKKNIFFFLLQLILISSLSGQVIKVEIKQNEDGSFTLLRGDEPYYIKGASSSNKALFPELIERGGNSIRTYGVDALTLSVLNEANKKGLSVMLGLWVSKEKDGFDYNNETKVTQQLEKFRGYVKQFRNHPALLAWSIGNEVEMGYTNLKVWDAINDISKMIHEEDGNHPTLTITACISVEKANIIAERAPDLDLLGINGYACISSIDSRIKDSNWKRPYIITEWGVNGPWEVSKSSWGAPFEPTSTEKKAQFIERYQSYIAPKSAIMPGSYAFLWNSKFEGTQIWFGLFVNEEPTEIVDGLEFLWTDQWPDNRAPEISSVKINSLSQKQNVKISAMSGNLIIVEAYDYEGDELNYEYLILPESGSFLVESIPGASFAAIPDIVEEQGKNQCVLNFKEVHNNQNLRLYVLIRDGFGHLATASFPFQTKFSTSGLKDDSFNSDSKLQAFPNPVRKTLTIQSTDKSEFAKIQLFNDLGMLLYELNTKESEETSIDMSNYSKGCYILKILYPNSNSVYKKIIRN